MKEEQIITAAPDDDMDMAYRDPEALSGYIRSRITNTEDIIYNELICRGYSYYGGAAPETFMGRYQ